MEPAMNARIPTSTFPPESYKDSTVFTSGNSQAVRIPKEFQLKTKQVKIIQRGGDLVIRPKYKTAAEVLANLPPIDTENLHEWDDFDTTIRALRDEPVQERDWNALFGDAAPLSKSRSPKKPAPRTGTSLKPATAPRKVKGAKTP
jgi:virulence-associated protein VagC